MSSFKTIKSNDVKIRLDALKNADEFAKLTFIALRKNDTCLRRLLRFFRIIPKQKL